MSPGIAEKSFASFNRAHERGREALEEAGRQTAPKMLLGWGSGVQPCSSDRQAKTRTCFCKIQGVSHHCKACVQKLILSLAQHHSVKVSPGVTATADSAKEVFCWRGIKLPD